MQTIKKLTKNLAIIIAILSLPACQIDGNSNQNNKTEQASKPVLVDTQAVAGEWQLHAWYKNDISQALIKGDDGKPVRIGIDAQKARIYVLNGCNNLSAPYQFSQGQLQVGLWTSTRKLCEPPLMQVDSLMSQLLTTDSQWQWIEKPPHGLIGSVRQGDMRYDFVRTSAFKGQ